MGLIGGFTVGTFLYVVWVYSKRHDPTDRLTDSLGVEDEGGSRSGRSIDEVQSEATPFEDFGHRVRPQRHRILSLLRKYQYEILSQIL